MTVPITGPILCGLRGTAGSRQARYVLAILTVVLLVDQLTKWWAWRHIPDVVINRGGTWLLGHTVGSWYCGDLSGALLDLLSTQVLALGLFALLRRPRSLAALLGGAGMISGWASNLGDRLGLHLITAPGMARGAIDFLHYGRTAYNVADVCIVAGTVLLGLALCRRHRPHAQAQVAGASAAPAGQPRPWRRARRWALLAAVTPALLGTAATLTATGGHLHTSGGPVMHSHTQVFRGGPRRPVEGG